MDTMIALAMGKANRGKELMVFDWHKLEINGEFMDCYKMQSETGDWDSETFWPESAKEILRK